MEIRAKLRTLPFLGALARAQQRYDLDMVEDDFIEEAHDVWRSLGNTAVNTSRFFAVVGEDLLIKLPMDCEFITSVTSTTPSVTSRYDSAGANTHIQRNDSVLSRNQSLSSTEGESVNYVLEKGYIRITSTDLLGEKLLIVYNSIAVGEDGLPLLNDKEVSAIAAEVTRREIFRRVFRNVKGADKILQFITIEATRLVAAAKIDEFINDDSIDKLLDIKSSWDRKVYGRRFNLSQ